MAAERVEAEGEEGFASPVFPSSQTTMVFVTMLFLGASTLFPWLAYITATDYFVSQFGGNVMYLFAVCYMVPLVICTVYLTFGVINWSTSLKINGGLVALIFLLLIVPILIPLMSNGTLDKDTGKALVFVSIGLCAVVTSVLQAAVFGLAAVFGGNGKYLVAVQTGQGTAGLVIVVIRVLTKLGFHGPSGNNLATIMYFACAILIMVVTLGMFNYIRRMPMGQHSLNLLADSAKTAAAAKANSASPDADNRAPLMDDVPSGNSALGRSSVEVIKVIWPFMVSVCFVFMVCLSCFPGMATSMPASVYCWWKDDESHWLGVIQVASYNCGDFVGKFLPNYIHLRKSHLYAGVVLHLGFIPLFILAINPQVLPWAFHSLWFPITITFLLGSITGLLGCTALMLGPGFVADIPAEKEKAGMIMSLSLISGLFWGSWLGLGISFAL